MVFRSYDRNSVLAKTLMTIMVIVRTARGYAVMPWDEFDGSEAELVREYDPFSS